MIKRFCLYGFLKNFDFSEPFIILFYLSLGLNFFQIGILTAFLNVLINLMEIPSGSCSSLRLPCRQPRHLQYRFVSFYCIVCYCNILNLFENFRFRTGYIEMRCSKSCYLCDLELASLFETTVIEQTSLHHLELPKIFCYNIGHANKPRKYKE